MPVLRIADSYGKLQVRNGMDARVLENGNDAIPPPLIDFFFVKKNLMIF